MASMKPNLFVVVWEWENKQGRWRPYPPEVTQQLERAFSKGLRSVFLGDADPALSNYSVNLSTLYQTCQQTGDAVAVRRNFYPQSSPAGQGAVWQWNGDNSGDWHVYDMPVQCIIEESWAMGAQTVDMSNSFPLCPYIINFCSLTQTNKRSGFIRSIRRIQQAAYPVGRPPTQAQQESSNGYRGMRPASQGSRMVNGGLVTQGTQITATTRINNPSCSPSQGSSNSNGKVNGSLNKRRGSRGDEVEGSNTSDKKTGILHKMFGRGQSGPSSIEGLSNNSGCSSNSQGSYSSGSSNSSSSNIGCSGRSSRGTQSPGQPYTRVIISSSSSSSPPKPLPRSMIPPTPLPRTHVPPPSPSKDSSFVHPDLLHHHPILHQNPDSPHHTSAFSRTSHRSESGSGHGRFGSNHTIDSDCSSSIGGRRPSIDTISTYLSLDSCNVEDQNFHHTQGESRSPCNPRVASLINVDSEESMDTDDEVFSVADAEVANISTAVAHVAARNSPSRSSHAQDHLFVPISAPNAGCETGLQYNGVKRKRTGERASLEQGHHSHHHHPFSHNHNAYYHGQGSRAPIKPEDKLKAHSDKAAYEFLARLQLKCCKLKATRKYDINDSRGVLLMALCKQASYLTEYRELMLNKYKFNMFPKYIDFRPKSVGTPLLIRNMDEFNARGDIAPFEYCCTIDTPFESRGGVPVHSATDCRPGKIGSLLLATIGFVRERKLLATNQEGWRRR
ncbi:unnamed protein product, partial [Meganyctiphanes norvegica]